MIISNCSSGPKNRPTFHKLQSEAIQMAYVTLMEEPAASSCHYLSFLSAGYVPIWYLWQEMKATELQVWGCDNATGVNF